MLKHIWQHICSRKRLQEFPTWLKSSCRSFRYLQIILNPVNLQTNPLWNVVRSLDPVSLCVFIKWLCTEDCSSFERCPMWALPSAHWPGRKPAKPRCYIYTVYIYIYIHIHYIYSYIKIFLLIYVVLRYTYIIYYIYTRICIFIVYTYVHITICNRMICFLPVSEYLLFVG